VPARFAQTSRILAQMQKQADFAVWREGGDLYNFKENADSTAR
jgi:hypothetical protein